MVKTQVEGLINFLGCANGGIGTRYTYCDLLKGGLVNDNLPVYKRPKALALIVLVNLIVDDGYFMSMVIDILNGEVTNLIGGYLGVDF